MGIYCNTYCTSGKLDIISHGMSRCVENILSFIIYVCFNNHLAYWVFNFGNSAWDKSEMPVKIVFTHHFLIFQTTVG